MSTNLYCEFVHLQLLSNVKPARAFIEGGASFLGDFLANKESVSEGLTLHILRFCDFSYLNLIVSDISCPFIYLTHLKRLPFTFSIFYIS